MTQADTTPPSDASGYRLTFGTLDEARARIGERTEVCVADCTVNEAMIQYYCSSVEDANPSHWDRHFADEMWGALIAPPAMLQSWIVPFAWHPKGAKSVPVIAFQIPLPGLLPINIATDVEFFRSVRVGDVLHMTDRLISVSDEKSTRLGIGHYVTSEMEFRDQRSELLARATNVIYRYRLRGELP
jgi:acyl dehydratase